MSQPKINNYVDSLQRQIADVAARVKYKQEIKGEYKEENKPSYGYVLKTEGKAYNLIAEDMVYSTLGQSEAAGSYYVSELYGFVAKLDRSSSVIEGLIFKNNQQFDFKV